MPDRRSCSGIERIHAAVVRVEVNNPVLHCRRGAYKVARLLAPQQRSVGGIESEQEFSHAHVQDAVGQGSSRTACASNRGVVAPLYLSRSSIERIDLTKIGGDVDHSVSDSRRSLDRVYVSVTPKHLAGEGID